ncbi:MAG TPA: histidine kinase [Pseudonocardiaceae bacterium]|jgi:signal transduction histidine kinase|nr:histidine kinase [Pseudonocardiaceae bacterium]
MLLGALNHWVRNHPRLLIDAGAVALAVLDVILVVPHHATVTTGVLSTISCVALILRRKFPFLVTLAVIPGYIWGWAELAAMIALGTLAWRKGLRWQTIIGAVGVWAGTFILFPLSVFTGEDWHHHVLDAMYGFVFAIGPMALGLLINARRDLSERVDELAASREREERLMSAAVRADERAKLAREMHDLVSHQVSLIAMQAGALQVSTEDAEARETAATIRKLSVRTLDELRQLVGTLRTAVDETDEIGLDGLADLVRESAVRADLSLDLGGRKPPGPVANAVFRTVQEALTNVHKHAAQAHTTVAVLTNGERLEVEVRNDAPPVPAALGQPTMRPLPSGGHGLLGLRERAELLGGSFEAGPVGRGGFLVRASFPLRRSSDWV